MSERRGALALVLHSHMPYVEGFGTWPFGEEWLWEAVACVYLPLLDLLDGAPVTIGLTPVLCDQLEAMRGEPGDRYLRFLGDVRAEMHAEDSRGLERGGEDTLAAEVRRAAGDYERAAASFERRGRDLLGAFEALGGVELWTSSATHAVLPLLATDAGLRLQLGTGIASHRRRFGGWSGGLWLPECAYAPGLESELAEQGCGASASIRPSRTGSERPSSSSRSLWTRARWRCRWTGRRSSSSGASATAIRATAPTVTTTAARSTTCAHGPIGGEPYDHEAALALARDHAREFVARVRAACRAGGGLVCCALDTELLGHWWYEGPEWLAAVLGEAGRRGSSS